jgi:hypothetical protein
MTNKLYISRVNSHLQFYAIGIQGDKKFRQLTENLLVNYGVISPFKKIKELKEDFGYFFVDINRLHDGLIQYYQNLLWVENRDKDTNYLLKNFGVTNWIIGQGKYLAIKLADQWIKNLIKEDFYLRIKSLDFSTYRILLPRTNRRFGNKFKTNKPNVIDDLLFA